MASRSKKRREEWLGDKLDNVIHAAKSSNRQAKKEAEVLVSCKCQELALAFRF